MTNDRNYTWYVFVKVMNEYFGMSVKWLPDSILLYKESVKLVSVAKSNKMSHEFIKILLDKIGIDIKDFEKGYQNITNSKLC